jgi:hypothetical protein
MGICSKCDRVIIVRGRPPDWATLRVADDHAARFDSKRENIATVSVSCYFYIL